MAIRRDQPRKGPEGLGEILSLRWADVNFEHGILLLGDSKTGRETIFLSKPALELLDRLPRLWVFSALRHPSGADPFERETVA